MALLTQLVNWSPTSILHPAPNAYSSLYEFYYQNDDFLAAVGGDTVGPPRNCHFVGFESICSGAVCLAFCWVHLFYCFVTSGAACGALGLFC